MRKITADIIFPVSGPPMQKGVIIVDVDGTIIDLVSRDSVEETTLEVYSGIVVPGFVNAHCHLELSHLKGKVNTGTGLLSFLKAVVSLRAVDPEEIQHAIFTHDEQMHQEGIVAVGDICNTADTLACKLNSKIDYHSFVEMFDFMQDDWADSSFARYLEVYNTMINSFPDKVSAVPHSPYTVSNRLYEKLNNLNSGQSRIISIHNQETHHENQLFIDGGGGFPAFFQHFNVNLDHFRPIGQGSIFHSINYLDPQHSYLMVHNTVSRSDDIAAAEIRLSNVYWVTCPNANLYIENQLPDYACFLNAGSKMAIGTDSLTSNWQLSILEEIKTILKYQSTLSFSEVLRWATLNGAEALQIAHRIGSIEPGKIPGLVHINTSIRPDVKLDKDSRAVRIA